MKSFAPKVVKLFQNITPFGCISFVNTQFNNCGLAQLIDDESGVRWGDVSTGIACLMVFPIPLPKLYGVS